MDNLSQLKTRLFALTTRNALLRIAGALGFDGLEQRHTYAIINTIRDAPGISSRVLLVQLNDAELRLLANDLGVGGASREERLLRLVGYAEGATPVAARASTDTDRAPTAARAPTADAVRASTADAIRPPAPDAPAVRASTADAPAARAATAEAPGPSGFPAPGAVASAIQGQATAPLAAPTPLAPSAPALSRAPYRSSSGSPLTPPSPFDDNFTLAPPSSRSSRSRRGPSRLPGARGEPFVAIDFETADHGRDSACAVALVRVEGDQIVRRVAWLIRPPRREFLHTPVHGITWAMVAHQPTFAELWPTLSPVLDGASYFVAHNAPFDRSVLRACCAAAGLPEPQLPFECSVQMARRLWNPPSATLPSLCQRFGIPLQHHDAASDAEACARLVLVARSQVAAR